MEVADSRTFVGRSAGRSASGRGGDDFPKPGSQAVDTEHHKGHRQQSGEGCFESDKLLQFRFFDPCLASRQEVVEEHEHASENKGRQHVGKEGGFPWPRRGGIEVFEDGPNLNERHDFDLFSERPGERRGQVVHQQIHLCNQDDGERGVQRLEGVCEERVGQAQSPKSVHAVQGEVQPKQHECRGDQGPFDPPTNVRIEGALSKVEEHVLKHAPITR